MNRIFHQNNGKGRFFKPRFLVMLSILPFLILSMALTSPIGRVWMYVSVMALEPEAGQIATVKKLGAMGPIAAPGIRVAMHSPNANIRCTAIHAVQKWGSESWRVAPELVELLDDDFASPKGKLAYLSAFTLEKMDARAVPALIEGLDHHSESIRQTVASILGRFGPRAISSLPALISLLEDHSATVRQTAKKAICKIIQIRRNLSITELKKQLQTNNHFHG